MAYSVHHVPLGIDLNLTLDDLGHPERPGLWNQLYPGKFRYGDLQCMQCLEDYPDCPEYMYLRFWGGRRQAVHHNKNIKNHPAPETDRHKALKEREAKVAERAGFSAEVESGSRRGRRRTDVLITGSNGFLLGFEAQLSRISPEDVRRRTKAAGADSITPLWTTDDPNAAPINRAPWARIDKHPWTDIVGDIALPVQGGVRSIRMRQCDARGAVCPDRRVGRKCRGWHPRPEPIQLDLDDLVVRAAGQALVPLYYQPNPRSPKGHWYWVAANESETYLSYASGPKSVDEAQDLTAEAERAERAPLEPRELDQTCAYGRPWERPKSKGPRDTGSVDVGMSVDITAATSHPTDRREEAICACGQPLWAPVSHVRGYCEQCRIARGEPSPPYDWSLVKHIHPETEHE